MTPSIAIEQSEWTLPDRGRVGVLCLIATEFALFTIYLGGVCLLHREESDRSHAEPGPGIADLADDLPAYKQHHRRDWPREH